MNIAEYKTSIIKTLDLRNVVAVVLLGKFADRKRRAVGDPLAAS